MAHPAPMRIKVKAPCIDATARLLRVKAATRANLQRVVASIAGKAKSQAARKR